MSAKIPAVTPADDHASIDVAERISTAPLPTKRTLRLRQSLPLQALNAVKFGVRILLVSRADH
ncbi:MAG: hypothetical protein Q4Q03_05615 [Bowdeniella nasicola]|nr:hypothetical protein [Bowdeniella nasicola]